MRFTLLLLCVTATATAYILLQPQPQPQPADRGDASRPAQTWGEYFYMLPGIAELTYCHSHYREYSSHWQCLNEYKQIVNQNTYSYEQGNVINPTSEENPESAGLEDSDESSESSEPYLEPLIVTIVRIPEAYPVKTGSHTRVI